MRQIIRQNCDDMGAYIVHWRVTTCTCSVDSTDTFAVLRGATDQRSVIPADSEGLSGVAQALLGSEVLGAGIRLNQLEQRH